MKKDKIYQILHWATLILIINLSITPSFALNNSNFPGTILNQTVSRNTSYMYNIYLNTNWNCNNCNSEESSDLIPVYPNSTTLPPGTYTAYMNFSMTDQDSSGRWVKVLWFRVFDKTTNNTMFIINMNGDSVSCDGCYPWTTSYKSTPTTFTITKTVTPAFGFAVKDSSHNETYWLFVGTVTFIPH